MKKTTLFRCAASFSTLNLSLILGILCLGILPTVHAAETVSMTSVSALIAVSVSQISPGGEGSLDLSSLKGRVVYLDFWASWCGPCKQSFPWMKDVQQRFDNKGLVVVAVNLDKDRSLADGFLRTFHPMFPIIYDKDGKLAQQFKITAMPYSLLIDRNGKTQYIHSGFSDEQRQKLDDEIRHLLN
jgi:thiol-disulfide isomerase/thioredoxin